MGEPKIRADAEFVKAAEPREKKAARNAAAHSSIVAWRGNERTNTRIDKL
jgi:hypothetical protein